MSDGTEDGWGGSRVNSGRKKKAVVASSAPTRIQDTGMCLRILTSLASSSVQPNTVQARHAVNNDPQAVGYPAPPSTVPVRPPSMSAAIVQLNKDLADAALNHSPASSELTFDESLGDEEGEEDDSVNAEVAQKEMEEAEPKVLSENHQWLKTTLAQIVDDTTGRLKMPRCYKDGHFWVRPVDPVFALKRAAASGFAPTGLYLLPIFVWLPHFLPGRPDSFKCECGTRLILNGYNENPIARRVSTLSGPDYFLLTNRYLCSPRRGNDKGCGKSYQGSNPWIIRQLPEYVQRAFPACLSARSGLDTAELDVMKATFAGHFGADPFSKMVRELKVLHHNHLETMYYCAALHFGFRGPNNVPQFSKFEDPLGYAGYAPSRQYFKSMFTAWFSVHRTLIDRVMLSLPATIIKADHTYKIISVVYLGVNRLMQQCIQFFPPLREVYKQMQAELRHHGHPPTQLLYTDNPRAEQKFHENVNASLCENVQHIVLDPFSNLPPFKQSNIPVDYFSLQTAIDSACDNILVALASLPVTEPLVLSLSVKCTAEALHFIQLCSANKAYIFRVTHIKSATQVPPCLLSLLINKHIVKIGHQIRQSMQSISAAWSMPSAAFIDSASVIDLSHVAKVKGAVSDANNVKEDDIKKLAEEVNCVSHIYETLMKLDSVGLPLQPSQVHAGQLVTLVIGKAPLAEGELVAHNGTWPSPSGGGSMKVTPAYTVIKLTNVLLPGHVVAKHSQTLKWLVDNGGHAIVQIRTLRSRSLTPPHPSDYDPSLGVPAPMNPTSSETSPQHPPGPPPLPPHHTVQPDLPTYSHGENESFDAEPDELADGPEAKILRQPNVYNTLASRVLDDAYHFMDRLLRLLSKKHSVFKEFTHQFSETIFVRDQDDEAKVQEVLEKKGIPWEYAIRSKKAALNRRIQRYIPPPEKLAADLETLFNSFKDEARKTAETLLETVRLGFVSDPPGIALYYVRGKDWDGLILYCTVCGTNSVEGGVHMLIRRIFGSLRASPELTEATIGNWFLRCNRTIGHYNRTGRKWLSHFDIWLLDDLVEKALTLGIEPSVPVPRLLATRIATSGSFGIIPIGSAIAREAGIPQLPPLNLQAAPHYNNVLLHTLTRLCTKPCNIYRYIQLCQRAPAPIIPVHTVAEYHFFKQNVDAFRAASTRDAAPKLAYKTTNYIAFAVFWNRQVMMQSPQIFEADRRLYFKLPEQLLRHHKKTLQWKSSRATLYLGSNTECLAPIQELLGDANRLVVVLPAIPLKPEQVDFNADAAVSIDLESFNPMAIRRRVAEELRSDAHFDPVPSSENNVPMSGDNVPASENHVPSTSPSSANLLSPSADPSPAVHSQQMILQFNDGPVPSLTAAEPPFKKPRTGPGPETKTTRKPRRCG
ncbi:hypothetical protein DFH08DRAFT_1048015 [Mycena albidolilacea]|uniref:Uncharacterized protein n=1 Tax=Mycena albidolilacea TaxID=1033008 RepID=A0AAD7EYE8_9AGAR|nr:hypothetical protein DFH08DRAFT_1048015 [Mycena albidolilacea]